MKCTHSKHCTLYYAKAWKKHCTAKYWDISLQPCTELYYCAFLSIKTSALLLVQKVELKIAKLRLSDIAIVFCTGHIWQIQNAATTLHFWASRHLLSISSSALPYTLAGTQCPVNQNYIIMCSTQFEKLQNTTSQEIQKVQNTWLCVDFDNFFKHWITLEHHSIQYSIQIQAQNIDSKI